MKYLLCIVLTLSIAFLVSQSEPINADNETGDSSIKPVEIESSVEKENHVSDNGSQIKRIPTLAENMSPSNGRKPVNFLMTEAASDMLAADSFKKFMKKFHRVYSGPAELAMRQAVFTAKLLKIFMHNLKYYAGLVSYSLQIGPFADKTEAEFDALFTHGDTPFFEELTTKNSNGSDPARTDNKHNDDYEELHDDDKDTNDKPRFESIPVSMWGGSDNDDQPPDQYQYYDPYGNPIPSYGYQPYQPGGSSSGQAWDPNYYNNPYYSGQSSNVPDYDDTAGGSGESGPEQMFVDHRHCFTPVKNQLQCGACWAFSGISMLEYYHCMQTGVGYPIAFSEQYWIDCGYLYFMGCENGGSPNKLHLLAQQFGLLEEVYRPYVAEEQTCESAGSSNFQPLGDVKVKVRRTLRSADNIKRFLQRNIESGPIYVSMRLPTDFADMGKEVHSGKNCDGHGNHGMVVVGHGIKDNEEFWVIRNSHGSYWADEGYWKLSKNADDRCFGYVIKWEGVYFPVESKLIGHLSSSSSSKPPDSPPPSEPESSPEVSHDQKKKKKKKSLWRKLGLGG